MTLEDYNNFCMSLPRSTHVVQWGGSHVWKIGEKLFAVCSFPKAGGIGFTFKCSELSFQLLSEQPGCRLAPYFKSPWIQCYGQQSLDDTGLKLYIGESYRLILATLSKRKQEELRIGY
jgi:predicted DNA-binding protein (MmcQ/YjbR family)